MGLSLDPSTRKLGFGYKYFIWEMNPGSTVREMEKKNWEEKEHEHTRRCVSVRVTAVDE